MSNNSSTPPLIKYSKGIMVRPTGMAFQAAPKVTSQKSGDKIGEKNVFVMRGGALIPASIAVSKDARPVRVAAQNEKEEKPTVLALSDDEPPPLIDIKKEPIDEEVEVKLEPAEPAFNTIKEGEPLNLSDFLENYVKKESSPEQLVLHLPRHPYKPSRQRKTPPEEDRPSTSSANARVPYIAKRSRKSLRRSEYFYGEEKDDELEPDCKISKTAEQVEDVCRCEYVVPELETRMDRLMDKMGFIETLAKTLLLKEEHREASTREELTNAHAEIAHLKRQIIIQRNQKSLNNHDHK